MRRIMQRIIHKTLFAVALVASFAAAAFAQDAKAEQILKQARAAIADDGKWKNLQSLSATGTQRSTGFNNQPQQNDLQLDLLLPDKVMRTTTSPLALARLSR